MAVIGFVRPNYDSERRVALLPEDIPSNTTHVYDRILVESGFGRDLGIDDDAYRGAGCVIASREQCFASDVVFSLKLINSEDYHLLRSGGKVIGWMHPNGSGREFCAGVAKEKSIDILDMDSVYPRIYFASGDVVDVSGLPPYFFWRNSYIAGMAATRAAFELGVLDQDRKKSVVVLGSGSVSQGAFCYLASIGYQPRMFYRKTLSLFRQSAHEYDVVVNGIEVDVDDVCIIGADTLDTMKDSVLIVDAAADAGRAIVGTKYHKMASPFGFVRGRRYFLVNNAPSLMFREASSVISKVVGSEFLTRSFFE